MPSYVQLESEPWWGREVITQAMTGVGLMLRSAYGVGSTAFGTKGNNAHLSGGHRSQEWIKNSRYCTSRTYTVQSGLTAAQARLIGAFDFTPGVWGSADNRAKMIVITKRLDSACKAGALDGIVREFFGTLDGRTVYGLNNVTKRQISADDSHLDHAHVGVNRAVADDNDAMARIAHIMLGEDMSLDAQDANTVWYTKNLPSGTPVLTPATALLSAQERSGKAADGVADLQRRMTTVEGKLDRILAALESDAPGAGTGVAASGTGTFTWTAGEAGQ